MKAFYIILSKRTFVCFLFIYLTLHSLFFCFYNSITVIVLGEWRRNIHTFCPFLTFLWSFHVFETFSQFSYLYFFLTTIIYFFFLYNINQFVSSDIIRFKEISDFSFMCFPIVSFYNYDLIDRLNCVCV